MTDTEEKQEPSQPDRDNDVMVAAIDLSTLDESSKNKLIDSEFLAPEDMAELGEAVGEEGDDDEEASVTYRMKIRPGEVGLVFKEDGTQDVFLNQNPVEDEDEDDEGDTLSKAMYLLSLCQFAIDNPMIHELYAQSLQAKGTN